MRRCERMIPTSLATMDSSSNLTGSNLACNKEAKMSLFTEIRFDVNHSSFT